MINQKALLLIFVLLIAGCSQSSNNLDNFAVCISENDAVMYGTEGCSYCQSQKAEFSSSVKYVNYIDCDKQKDVCLRNNIKRYPTWIINGEYYTGYQPLDKLASLTGCDLYEE